MHATQIHIMSVLQARSPRRYSELRPREVEGNVFMHHLRQVMDAGLVEKVPGAYGLTVVGQRFVTTLDSALAPVYAQTRILVEVACQNEAGEWLLFRWNKEPFRGLASFPAGRMLEGEDVAGAARRQALRHTGYEVVPVHVGNLYATTLRQREVVSRLLTHVCVGQIVGGELKAADASGTAFWQKLDEAELEKPGYFPGLPKLMWHLAHRPAEGQFFGEYVFEG